MCIRDRKNALDKNRSRETLKRILKYISQYKWSVILSLFLALITVALTPVSYTHLVLPPPSIAVTMMEGYEKDNVVPGNVRLLLDFRIHPGMDLSLIHILAQVRGKHALGGMADDPGHHGSSGNKI